MNCLLTALVASLLLISMHAAEYNCASPDASVKKPNVDGGCFFLLLDSFLCTSLRLASISNIVQHFAYHQNIMHLLLLNTQYMTGLIMRIGKSFMGGVITEFAGAVENVHSPILDSSESEKQKHVIGSLAQMKAEDSMKVLEHARAAWDSGHGVWP